MKNVHAHENLMGTIGMFYLLGFIMVIS
jgi:hypothetical protein